MKEKWIQELNAENSKDRIKALTSLVLMEKIQPAPLEAVGYVNNHIHTTYSFSPYSPTMAVWMAKEAGLLTAGIVDHDSISGALEFITAGRLLQLPVTIGIECRVNMKDTPFADRRLNNTDQLGIAYVAMHGIPHAQIEVVDNFLKPYRLKRNIRNRRMVIRINELFKEEILDFDRDIVPLSKEAEGGSITERHLLYALSLKLIQRHGQGEGILEFLKTEFGLEVKGKALEQLLDEQNPFYAYDLLGVLKGHFVSRFYIDADEECPMVTDFVEKALEVGAIPAYAYLGDVRNSVTGDKRDDFFEDAYLDELLAYLKSIGFLAVTYMPSRNTTEQLMRLRGLCDEQELFQISGEDINSPRQSFKCEALLKPEYSNLIQSTWAMIGHERAATEDPEEGLFRPKRIEELPLLSERIAYYERIGKAAAFSVE